MNNYKYDCTRKLSDENIEVWKKGEECFSKFIGVEYKSKFVREGDNVEIFYEEEQGNKVHEAICKFLEKDGNFDRLCDNYFNDIDDKHKTQAKMMVFLIIADEIDKYSEIASDDDKRRLKRVRETTHEESYKWTTDILT